MQAKIQFPTIQLWHFIGSGAFQLLFGFAWRFPLILFIGEPLLGHWLYVAAKEYADSSA
jgi:hypothetical protein